jgi:predicted Zn-ribbon and HTH transcriptional regulator
MSMVKIPMLKCNKCGHEWVPRIKDVRVCPKCHSVKWDK